MSTSRAASESTCTPKASAAPADDAGCAAPICGAGASASASDASPEEELKALDADIARAHQHYNDLCLKRALLAEHIRGGQSNDASGLRRSSGSTESVNDLPTPLSCADSTSRSCTSRRSSCAESNDLPELPLTPPNDVVVPPKAASMLPDEDSRATMKTIFDVISMEDPGSVIIVRRINKMGFASQDILQKFFSRSGAVKGVHMAHSRVATRGKKAGWRMRPASVGFVVMQSPITAARIITEGKERNVDGYQVILQPFFNFNMEDTNNGDEPLD